MKIEIDLEEFAEQVKAGQSVTAKGGCIKRPPKTANRNDSSS